MENSKTVPHKEYKFKMDKVERNVSLGIFVIFILSFYDIKNMLWTILLYTVAGVVFIYYFLWYRKKSFYVRIEKEGVTICAPLFFKPQDIKKQEIEKVDIYDKKIEIRYNLQGISKKINIYSIMLQEDDYKQLSLTLNNWNKKTEDNK